MASSMALRSSASMTTTGTCVSPAIRAALGGNVTLYDGSDGTARETLRQLVRRGWVRGGSHGTVTLENSLPSELPLSRRLLALPRED